MADVKMPRTPLGTGNNWVTQTGGLPPILRGVARHMMAQGRSESESIAIAINWAKKMCATGRAFGEKVAVSPEARAQACAAVARWESMKAAARATPNKGASLSNCADCSQTVDLAAWDGAKHPRVSKGKAGGGRFAGKNSDGGPPEDVQAQVRDFQRRHGLPQTGQFDAATTKLMQYHASGAAAKAAAGAKKAASGAKAAARKQASAAKKAAAKAARDRKHAQALAKAKAKREAAAKKKAEKAAAAAARQRASATVSAVNRLTPAQRRVYRAKSPTPPAGYAWGAGNKLVSVTSARAQSAVSKTLGPAPKPAAKKVAAKPKATSFRQMLSRRKTLNLSERPGRSIDLGHPHPGQRYKHGWIKIGGGIELEPHSHKSAIGGGITHYSVHRDGKRIGVIDQTAGPRVRAIRAHGEPGVDINRVKHFGSKEAAAKWIAKGKAGSVSLSEQATSIDLATTVTSTTDGPSLTVPAGSLTAKAKRVLLRRKMAMPPATPNGEPRFPIRNHDDVKKAVRAVGRAKGDHAAVRRHIVRRARAVGASHLIPDHWGEANLAASEGRAVDLSQPQRFRRELIIDLAAARGHHVPGTAYHWRHNWRPIDVYTALKHRRPDLARHLLRHGAPFHNDEPRGFPAPRRLNIPLESAPKEHVSSPMAQAQRENVLLNAALPGHTITSKELDSTLGGPPRIMHTQYDAEGNRVGSVIAGNRDVGFRASYKGQHIGNFDNRPAAHMALAKAHADAQAAEKRKEASKVARAASESAKAKTVAAGLKGPGGGDWQAFQLESDGSRVGDAAVAKVRQAFVAGDTKVIVETPLSKEQTRSLLEDITASVDKTGLHGVTFYVPSGDRHFRGTRTITGAYVRRGQRFVFVNPKVANGSVVEHFRNSDSFMPANKTAPGRQYTLVHELGHVRDHDNQHTESTHVMSTGRIGFTAPRDDVAALEREHRGALSKYGRSSLAESYAEAYAQWIHGGPGSSPVADAYARRFGWEPPK